MIDKIISTIIAHRAGIMLGGAAVGVVVTAVMASKDARKHAENQMDTVWDSFHEDDASDEEEENFLEGSTTVYEQYKKVTTKKERAIIFAKSYWRTGLSMAVTFGLMILSHRTMVKELTATAAALGIMTSKYKELDSELKKKYPEVHEKIHKLIDQKNIRKEISKKGLKKEETYDGRNRYYEEFSKEIFYATEAQIKEAECTVNEQLMNTGECSLFTYLATFPKSSGIKLKDWMKHVGWYEGDTSYSYSSSYFGSYVKPEIVNEPIIFEGEKININKIRWSHVIDFNPELDNNEIGCIEAELEGIA